MLVTLNQVIGESVYGEKRMSVEVNKCSSTGGLSRIHRSYESAILMPSGRISIIAIECIGNKYYRG